MKLIYLASPYSHKNFEVQVERFRLVCAVAAKLMSEGNFVFSPIAHTHPIAMAGKLPTGWDYWQAYDHRMIDACDEVWVLRLPGWEESKGVSGEVAYAVESGKTIRFVD